VINSRTLYLNTITGLAILAAISLIADHFEDRAPRPARAQTSSIKDDKQMLSGDVAVEQFAVPASKASK
jgi:hypothetical protein